MFFISKKDVIYTVFIWGTIALGFITIVFPIFSAFSIANFIVLVLSLIVISWLIWVWFSLGYSIENNTLIIKAGPFKQKVDIQKIKKISKGKSVVTSAALSIDRMLIHYGSYKYASISPKKELEFIKILLSKNPQIEIDDALTKLL